MKATLDRLEELVVVASILWSNHHLEDIKVVLEKYIKGDNTEVFMYLDNDKCI